MSQIPCFVINLARSAVRLNKISSQFDALGLAFQRIDAVDATTLTEQDIKDFYDANHEDAYYKHLNTGELGCYLSHRKAWQRMVEQQIPYAVVLEDDICLDESFTDVLSGVEALPNDWDYIKLAEYPLKRRVVQAEKFASITRVTYNKVPARTCAQIVSLSGAQKLLKHSERVYRPIDIDLQYWWEKDLRVFGILPYAVTPDVSEDSEIDRRQQRRHAKHSLRQKWRNMWQLFWLNRQHLQRRLAALQRAE